jgi:hypothetical protein
MKNIIDQMGMLDQIIKTNEAELRKLKAEFIASNQVGKYKGDEFLAEIQHYDRATINPILVREFADEEFVSKVTQVKPIDAVVIKPL